MGPLHQIHTYPLWVGLPQIKLVKAQFSKGPGKMYSLKQAMLCLSLIPDMLSLGSRSHALYFQHFFFIMGLFRISILKLTLGRLRANHRVPFKFLKSFSNQWVRRMSWP